MSETKPAVAPMPEAPSEEVKKAAFEKIASIKIYQLFLIAEVINLASSRGAFRGPELSHVGALFDTISAGIDQSFKMAKEELDKAKEAPASLDTIAEEPSGSEETKKDV